MSTKEMRPLTLSIGASLLPSFSLVTAASRDGSGAGTGRECHGKICHPIDEYCSEFTETCNPCADICNDTSHNYEADICAKECADYNKFVPLKAEIDNIQKTQHLILWLLSILLIVIVVRYLLKFLGWLRHTRCMLWLLKKLKVQTMQQRHQAGNTMPNGKDLNATTIQNLNAISRDRDIERAPSQIYSITGAAEGSVLTVTTPVSTRYPAENSTTPTTEEFSYDNQAMVVTPVTEKPSTATTTMAF